MNSHSPISLRRDEDIVLARQAAQRFARDLGLTSSARARLDLVVAELATNVVRHAGRGAISFLSDETHPRGLIVRCQDQGDGIAATRSHPRPGLPGLGFGLAVARDAANQLEVSFAEGNGTLVEARIWD